MTFAATTDALARVVPIAVFLLAITVVAEICDRAGVFDVAAHRLARLGRGRTVLLWLLFSFFAVTCTVFLSLDTTAVLLTPVALALARELGVARRPFALTTLWIANTGSLLLPVSNLTNLMALTRFEALGVDHGDYLRLAAAPGLVAIGVTLLLVAVLHHADLRGRYATGHAGTTSSTTPAGRDRLLLTVATTVCLLIGPAFAVGLPPWAVALAALLVLVLVAAWRDAAVLRGLPVPWAMAAGFAALTLVVSLAHAAGWLDPLLHLAGTGTGPVDLLRLAGVTAVTANAVDNLPAYLALEPAAVTDPARLLALLVGTNCGPLVTPWGSLATLLWLQRCSAAGVRWHLPRLALLGLLCATLTVVAATLTIAVLLPTP